LFFFRQVFPDNGEFQVIFLKYLAGLVIREITSMKTTPLAPSEICNFVLSKGNHLKLLFLREAREKYIKSLKFGNDDQYREMNE